MRIFFTLAMSMLGLLGCGEDPPAPGSYRLSQCVDEAAPSDGNEIVWIGKSEGDIFHPLSSSDSLTIYHGPQGGQHCFISLKLFAKQSDRWEHSIDVIDSATQAPAGGTRVPVMSCAGKWMISHDITLFLDYDSMSEGTIRVQSETAPDSALKIKISAEAPAHFISE